jgi:hypothetical protein
LATAQSQQSNNYKDVVQQLNEMTNERKGTAQELANMTHELNKKEAEHQYARRRWQEHYDYIQWLYQNWASGEKYGKSLVEIQHLKQSSASNEDCKKAQAEIEHLRQNGVSKRFSALGMAAFATCSP